MTTTLSPKFQVVIPKSVRELFDLKPGMKIQVIAFNGRIELIPLEPVQNLKGAYPDLNPHLEREDRL